jgi:hypothetical protein
MIHKTLLHTQHYRYPYPPSLIPFSTYINLIFTYQLADPELVYYIPFLMECPARRQVMAVQGGGGV